MNENVSPELVLEATDVSVAGPHDPLVVAPDFVVRSGSVTVVPVDPGVATAALALAVGGRIALATGRVSLSGETSREVLQRRTRLVDVDGVSAPEEALPVHAIVAEELSLRDLPSRRHEVERTLEVRGLQDSLRRRWDSLPADERTSVLIDIAAAAPGTAVIVVAGPDRHAGSTGAWAASAQNAADSGHAVLVLTARKASP